ncbi:exosortase K [Ohtaekwangia kribbensis]|jgi:exosortase K|uniref:Exosortase K n=1 Tax=Ohtaekwangia kribbensis TaxID=688913 RepID=A0ABW3K2R0_9BACT
MKNLLNKTALWFGVTVVTAIVLKILFTAISSSEFTLMLNPANAMLEYIFDTRSVHTHSGFYFPDLNITLNHTFSGENYLILVFCILSLTAPYHVFKPWQSVLVYIGILVTSFMLTLIISALRIISALPVLRIQDSMPWLNSFWMQRVEGGIIYFSALLLVYLLFKNVFVRIAQHYKARLQQAVAVARMVVVYRRNSHQL